MPSIALVTGGNRGIGRAVCRQLIERGWTVVLGARDAAAGERIARELDPGGDVAIAVALDVADDAGVRAAAALVTKRYGRLDALVNNAAILEDRGADALTVDLGLAHRAVETNVFGPWRTIQAFAPLVRRSEHGRIVNVSSGLASLESMGAGTPVYSLTKAALSALTRIVADELRPDRVLVNAISPGWTATDMGGAGGRPVEEGAASIAWGVTLPDDGPTGGFFMDGQPVPW